MIDILLVAGVAFCALSVLMAIVSVARTQAPRGAALALVLGIALMFAGAWLDQRPFGIAALSESWQRLVSGESLGAGTVAEPASSPAETPAEPPAPAAAGTEATAPAETAPVETTPAETPPAAGTDGDAPAQ